MLQVNIRIFLAFLLFSALLITGCGQTAISQNDKTSTIESTIIQDDTVNCPKDFLRKEIHDDGSITEYCLSAEFFNLSPCLTNQDCTSAEYCDSNGYCQGLE